MSKWVRGKSGNPAGKAQGTLNKRTKLVKLLEPHAEELINKTVQLAKNGDVNALRLCLERLLPKIKNETISINLPDSDLSKLQSLLDLGSMIIHAVANEDITPEQGKLLVEIVESQRKTIETTVLADRINEIEHSLNQRKMENKHDKT